MGFYPGTRVPGYRKICVGYSRDPCTRVPGVLKPRVFKYAVRTAVPGYLGFVVQCHQNDQKPNSFKRSDKIRAHAGVCIRANPWYPSTRILWHSRNSYPSPAQLQIRGSEQYKCSAIGGTWVPGMRAVHDEGQRERARNFHDRRAQGQDMTMFHPTIPNWEITASL
eukprot:3087930-Rhodomonas_salina.2